LGEYSDAAEKITQLLTDLSRLEEEEGHQRPHQRAMNNRLRERVMEQLQIIMHELDIGSWNLDREQVVTKTQSRWNFLGW